MTAITLLITKHCSVHAVDSLVTVEEERQKYVPDDWNFQKIVRVESEFWGAMSFWGLAKSDLYNWNTPAWLSEQAANVGKMTAEAFANKVAHDLQEKLNKMTFGTERPTAKGIGIHFSAYERIDSYWVPELFLITNWNSLPYTSIDPHRVHVSRETYSILERSMNNGTPQTDPSTHGAKDFRMLVHNYLHTNDSNWFIFNNGDPEMFGAFASGVHRGYSIVSARGGLKDRDSATTYRKLAELPIKLVADTQTKFCAEHKQLVGGRVHNLSIEPGHTFASDTGD